VGSYRQMEIRGVGGMYGRSKNYERLYLWCFCGTSSRKVESTSAYIRFNDEEPQHANLAREEAWADPDTPDCGFIMLRLPSSRAEERYHTS